MNVASAGAQSTNLIGPLPADKVGKLKKVSEGFQAIWLSHMLKEARGQGPSLLGNSMGTRMFKDMMDEALAEKMATQDVMGLTASILAQYSPAQPAAPAATSETGHQKP